VGPAKSRHEETQLDYHVLASTRLRIGFLAGCVADVIRQTFG
jgi:hypothetical protein